MLVNGHIQLGDQIGGSGNRACGSRLKRFQDQRVRTGQDCKVFAPGSFEVPLDIFQLAAAVLNADNIPHFGKLPYCSRIQINARVFGNIV
ncbi:hypothetical protein D3C75_1125030 [compost metagenome]